MDYLASEAYRVVDVLTAIDLLDNGNPLSRTAALSFDDGYLDNYTLAYPVLKRHGAPAPGVSLACGRESRSRGFNAR